MTVRVRGIYATALTRLFDTVVQASPPIEERFDNSFSMEPAAVIVETTNDRQGIGIHGEPAAVSEAVSTVASTGIDTFVWQSPLPRGGVFAGEVVETLGSGAVVECTTETPDAETESVLSELPFSGETKGFLPYSKTSRRLEEGDRLRVQVTEPRPPWDNGRPVLDTTVRVQGGLASLVRGTSPASGQPELADILPAEPPDGWGINWEAAADDAALEELSAVIETLGDRATALDDGLDDIESPQDSAPQVYYRGNSTCWVWFGRESRFALDEIRRAATGTMSGHHRIKAATAEASTAVDFVEAICAGAATESEFPFEVVTQQFGPREGDRVHIGHGKPDGRLIDLGVGEVTERTADGQVTVRREMSGRGTYDALGTKRERGDTAVTKFKEGRWWYPTVYRTETGESKGTYVNICTPVEVFPETIRYVDLHVDVIKHPDGTVERVDSDELDAAIAARKISEPLGQKARTVARAVENAFS